MANYGNLIKDTSSKTEQGWGGLLGEVVPPFLRWAHNKGLTSQGDIKTDYRAFGDTFKDYYKNKYKPAWDEMGLRDAELHYELPDRENQLIDALFGGKGEGPLPQEDGNYILDAETSPVTQELLEEKYLENLLQINNPSDMWVPPFGVNPDTGNIDYRIKENTSLTGDVHYGPEGQFTDYWDIGLNPSESMVQSSDYSVPELPTPVQPGLNTTNIKRALIDSFTTPPTLQGQIRPETLEGGTVGTVWDTYDHDKGQEGIPSSIDISYRDAQNKMNNVLGFLNANDMSEYTINPETYAEDPDYFDEMYPAYTYATTQEHNIANFANQIDLNRVMNDYPELRRLIQGE